MADIFISYARPNRDKIEKLSKALEASGYSVWWDRRIEIGAEFSKDIERELNEAKAVIVAWSADANQSSWVKDEASAAHEQQKLIPVRLDTERPPIGFRQYQSLDLSDWRGDTEAAPFQQLLDALKSIPKEGVESPSPPMARQSTILSDKRIWGGALALAVVVGLAAVAIISSRDSRSEPVADTTSSTKTNEAPAAKGDSATGAVSLAVLPFVNMSSDPEQEHFADGLTEELLNWLANVEGLEVPGRTSSFRYKGKLEDMREIGQGLNVQYLLEGSVRLSGDQLRITAQLIEAENGFHLWSQTYDRKLDGIFAIQDEISRLVVTELLGAIPESGINNPAAVGNVDAKAHELYLEGRALWNARNLPDAFEKFRAATEIDPNHALAQSYKAVLAAYAIHNGFTLSVGGESNRSIMNAAISRAVSLQPTSADVLFAQGWVQEFGASMQSRGGSGDSAAKTLALGFYDRAVRANPRHVEALHALSRITLDSKRKIELLNRVLDIDFGLVSARRNLQDNYLQLEDFDSAIQLAERAYTLMPETSRAEGAILARNIGDIERMGEYLFRDWSGPGVDEFSRLLRAAVLADLGRMEEAVFLLEREVEETSSPNWALFTSLQAHGLRKQSESELAIAEQIYNLKDRPRWANGALSESLLANGDPQRALEIIVEARPDLVQPNDPQINISMFNSVFDREAVTGALILDKLQRHDEADSIWAASIDASVSDPMTGWRQHLARAILHGHSGDIDAAISELQTAYDKGFRFVYSFNCNGCIDRDFYDANGYFEPLFEETEFQQILAQIEAENAATLARLDERHNILARVREMMAKDDQAGE